jgi:hypothetical protein
VQMVSSWLCGGYAYVGRDGMFCESLTDSVTDSVFRSTSLRICCMNRSSPRRINLLSYLPLGMGFWFTY